MRKSLPVRVLPLLGMAALALGGCNRSPQARESAYLKKAGALAAAKDFARAALELKNASQAMPRDAEPYYQQGLVELQTNNPQQAMANFRRALELNPNHAGAKLKAAELLAASSARTDVEEAARRLTEVVKVSPGTTEAVDSLAFTQWRLGKPEDAARLLEETLARFPADLQSAVALARIKLSQKDFAGAEEALKNLARNAPASSPAALALGRFYLLIGKPEQAEPQIQTAVQLDPKNGPALATLAAMQLQAGRKQEAEQTYQRLSMLPDKAYKSVHALFLFEEGRRDEAIAELDRLAKADPRDREIRSRLVSAYLLANRAAEAERTLNDALRRNPKDVDALVQRSRIDLDHEKTGEAEKDLQTALHFQPESIEVHAALADLYQQTGKALLERQELSHVLQLNPQLLQARIRLARRLTVAKQGDAALDLLNQAPASQRRALPVLAERNWAFYSLGRKAEFRQGIAEGKAAGASPEWSLQSGLLNLSEGVYSAARADAEEFLKQRPEDPRGASLLAHACLAQRQPQAAVDLLREIVAAHPKAAAVEQIYADLLAQTGDRAAARAAYLAAKAADPKSAQPDLKLAELDVADQKLDSARQLASEALARDPRNLRALLVLADIDQRTHQEDDAISRYRAAVEIDSGNIVVLNNLAYLLAAADPDEALKYAQQALESSPDNATVQDTIGWIYYRKGIYGMALRYLKSAVDREPTPRRQFHLGVTYLKSGDQRRGQELLTLALSKDPSLSKTEQGW